MSKYYLAVPVGERLPEENAQVCFITQNGKPYSGVWKFPRIWQKPNMNDSWDFNFFSHWLEPREGVLLQAEELEQAVENRLVDMMKENNPKLLSYFLTVATRAMIDTNAGTFELSQESTYKNKRYKTTASFKIGKIKTGKS